MATDEQRYSLRWNDFYSNILSTFKCLKDNEEFVDVTIACDGKSLKAHKVILSACSPFFRHVLNENPCHHPIVILKDVRYQEMESLLNFMYHGEVQISQDDLHEFLRTAQSLQVKGLTDVPHISLPRSRSPSITPPMHIPEVRLENMSDEPSCDSGSTKPQVVEDTDVTTDQSTLPNNHQSNTITDSSGDKADKEKDKEALSPRESNGPIVNANGKTQNSNNHHSSILIQALEQGRQNFDRDLTVEDSKNDLSAIMMDEDSSPDEADMRYDEKGMDGVESSEELSAHALSDAIRFPAAAALLGFQGLPGFLPGPSNTSNSDPNFVTRRGLEMLRVRATDPRPCPKCGKIYRSAHTLRTHLEDKHTICPGYRCVLCGTVAKSRNSLHSHMSRQHRGISTKDLPVLPMPAPFDPQLAAKLLAKAGVKFPQAELANIGVSPSTTRRSGLEVTAIGPGDGKQPSSPKSVGSTSASISKIDPGTTGSAILDTYLQFIAENTIGLGAYFSGGQRGAGGRDEKNQGNSSDVAEESGEEEDP